MGSIKTSLGGAVAGAILWLILNGLTGGSAARFVRDLGWPVSSYWLASAVIAGIATIDRTRNTRKKLGHSIANATRAAELGLTYSPTVERPPVPLPCLEKWHCGKDGNTVEIDGLTASAFDMTERIESDDGDGFRTRTIILMPAIGLPAFTSSPRSLKQFAHAFGFGGMTFDPKGLPPDQADTVRKFVRAVRIQSPFPSETWTATTPEAQSAEAAVRRLITPTVMATLLGQQGWSFQTAEGWLACWRGQEVWRADQRVQRIATANAVRVALLAAAADTCPVVVPPMHLPNGAQFVARGLGMISGVLLGLSGTFFVAIDIMEAFGLHHYSVVPIIVPFLATVAGAVVLGFIGYWIGAAVGRIPAMARWTPAPAATPEQKAEKDRRDSWQRTCGCLGFFAGGPLGFAVLLASNLLNWPENNASALLNGLFPILSIAGAIAGMVGGLILGSWIARRRGNPALSQNPVNDDPSRLGSSAHEIVDRK